MSCVATQSKLVLTTPSILRSSGKAEFLAALARDTPKRPVSPCQPEWAERSRAKEKIMSLLKNRTQLPLDQKSLGEAVRAAIEGQGVVYEALKELSNERPENAGDYFASWLLGKIPSEQIPNSSRTYMLNLAQTVCLDWVYERYGSDESAAILQWEWEKEKEGMAGTLLLQRLVRIGQWPQYVLGWDAYAPEDSRGKPYHGQSIAWLYAWLQDASLQVALLEVGDGDVLGNLPPTCNAVSREQLIFMLHHLSPEAMRLLIPERAQSYRFLMRLQGWLKCSEGPLDLSRAALPHLSGMPENVLLDLVVRGRYRLAAYELGRRLIHVEQIDKGEERASLRRSWIEGVLDEASSRIDTTESRISRYEFDRVTAHNPPVATRSYLRLWGQNKVCVMSEDTPFSVAETVSDTEYLSVTVTYEEAVSFLTEIDRYLPLS